MCGIVGGLANSAIQPLLLDGLQQLEYRGYDSAGLATISPDGQIDRVRSIGEVSKLVAKAASAKNMQSCFGIAHTRWATHGKPTEENAHPHIIDDHLVVVHNGIIENFRQLHSELGSPPLQSQTDTEIAGLCIAHELAQCDNLHQALYRASQKFVGSYALAIISSRYPEQLAAVRKGSPLVLGSGETGTFVASDPVALIAHTSNYIFIEDGESLEITREGFKLYAENGMEQQRQTRSIVHRVSRPDKGKYRHFMLKEIYEQPDNLRDTLGSYSTETRIDFANPALLQAMQQSKAIQMVACGTSYHAALVAACWIEQLAGIPCRVEVASEYRYRQQPKLDNVLYITLSQSGETADTLECLRMAADMGFTTRLAITNSPFSSIVRESDHSLITQAGVEVSVASTKAFTTQLAVLQLCALELARLHSNLDEAQLAGHLKVLHSIPQQVEEVLSLELTIANVAMELVGKNGVMFLGRGPMFPVALEGALKLKEIAYIHAEAYPAGELKHGPLALIDLNTPVIAVSPPGELLSKLHSNLEEVQARGAAMLLFVDQHQQFPVRDFDRVVRLSYTQEMLAPFIYTIPLQLLAYYTAVHKGTDVDKPRNLAKSVTVE